MTTAGPGEAHVAVYLVTHRRPHLLARAVRSVLAQTHRDLTLHLVNDAPDDPRPARLAASMGDARLRLFRPMRKRGAAASIELAFHERAAPFASLLEDDNWWEPDFLARQLALLRARPSAPVALCNERIWAERAGGAWEDTGETIWPLAGPPWREASLAGLCGRPRFANSAFVLRTAAAPSLRLPPGVPVDVTEHLRERLLPARVPVCRAPLVNWSRTLSTARGGGALWARWQVALIGSVFMGLGGDARRGLARDLWEEARGTPRRAALASAGLAMPQARALLWAAPPGALARAAAGLARRPARLRAVMEAPRRLSGRIDWLAARPLLTHLAESAGAPAPVAA